MLSESETRHDKLVNLHSEYSDSLAKFKEEKEKAAKIKSDLAALVNKLPTLQKKFEFDLIAYEAYTKSALAKVNLFMEEKTKDAVNINFPADILFNEGKEKFQIVI